LRKNFTKRDDEEENSILWSVVKTKL
jgi:hypothetical protein